MITIGEFAQLMLGVFINKQRARIALAVSGGADSLCLLYLVSEWAREFDHKIIAITVDHGLRREAAAEAEYVASVCAKLDVRHVTLKWDSGGKPKAAIQESARQARYQLMSNWCYENGYTTLMTAHHAKDNWETFMMRLAKGSGLTGLTGISKVTYHKFGQLIRPLLQIPHKRIISTLQSRGIEPVFDPSNNDENFARVRWRQMYDSMASCGLDAAVVQAAQYRLAQVDSHIAKQVANLLSETASVCEAGYVQISNRLLEAEPLLQQRVIIAVTYFLSQAEYVPPLSGIEYAIAELHIGRSASVASCTLFPARDEITVCRDIRTLPGTQLNSGEITMWAGLYKTCNSTSEAIVVKPLGKQGVRQLQVAGWIQKQSELPRCTHEVLLSFWSGNDLLAVPHLHGELPANLASDKRIAAEFAPTRSL